MIYNQVKSNSSYPRDTFSSLRNSNGTTKPLNIGNPVLREIFAKGMLVPATMKSVSAAKELPKLGDKGLLTSIILRSLPEIKFSPDSSNASKPLGIFILSKLSNHLVLTSGSFDTAFTPSHSHSSRFSAMAHKANSAFQQKLALARGDSAISLGQSPTTPSNGLGIIGGRYPQLIKVVKAPLSRLISVTNLALQCQSPATTPHSSRFPQ
jgi:hypothetical protein